MVSTPDDFDLDEVNQEGECQTDPGGEGRMVCSYGDLAPGAEIVLRFRGQFRDDEDSRTHVFVESLTPDPDPSNNRDRQGVSTHENRGGGQGSEKGDIDFFEVGVPPQIVVPPLGHTGVEARLVGPGPGPVTTPYRFETPDDDGGAGCDAENEDPFLRLYDSDGNQIAEDDDGGGGSCALNEEELEPGETYFVSIEELQRDDVISDYELEIDQGDNGVGDGTTSESESNNSTEDADGPFTGDQTVTGAIE